MLLRLIKQALAGKRPGANREPVEVHLDEADGLTRSWRIDEAAAALDRALRAAPQNREIFSGVLLFRHYLADQDPRALFDLHRQYGRMLRNAVREPIRDHPNAADPDRPLRIGYVSRNLSRHSVGYFIEPVIARHDRDRYPVFCYYTHPHGDETTERIAGLAHVWRHVHAQNDSMLAATIRDDRIDILVDLGGHTKLNRLGVFARKPAPVQMTWLGYPDTTGLVTIDYRVSDSIADPAGVADDLHSERVLRLPPPFLCYRPPADSPPVAIRANEEKLVFGSFNMLAKLNEHAIDAWARILHAVPEAHVLLKSGTLEHDDTAARVRESFEARRIDGSRVDLKSWSADRVEHLAAYGDIDIALDTFPYNGTTTTCEALWMGVPVVTLAGEAHMSRVGATLLDSVGLDALVAPNVDEYVRIAVELARDHARREDLRSGMRQRLMQSPLLDHAGFVARLEQRYRDAWSAWCRSQHGR